jgi:hypothetical protein
MDAGKAMLTAGMRKQLDVVHGGLLDVHKQLLDHERERYERAHGRIASAGQVLQLVIEDPWFAWLRPLTAVIAAIDEVTASKEPVAAGSGEGLVAEAKRLLTPAEAGEGFAREYFRAAQESLEVAAAHGRWKRVLAGP